MNRTIAFLAATLVLNACGPDSTTGVADDSESEAMVAATAPGAMHIKVYAQNAYPGFNIDAVEAAFAQGPEAAVMALTNGLLVLDATNWRERAARMAQEVAVRDPDVIVLNELVTIQREGFQAVSGFLAGTPLEPLAPYWAQLPDATTDFLPVFAEELARLGLRYDLVDTLRLTDVTVPIPGFPITVAARYVDRDAMFARADVQVGTVTTDTVAVTLQTITTQSRGWIAAEVDVHGKPWLVVGTHPSPSWPAAGRTPQVTELIEAVAGSDRATIIAGDLNLEPGSAEHAELADAGFVDLWTRRNGTSAAANTCCHGDDETLRDVNDGLEKRIDYVLARPAAGYAIGPVNFGIFGDDPAERTATGMWPSDHAGLFATLVLQARID